MMKGDEFTIGVICSCCGKEITLKEIEDFKGKGRL